MRFITNLNRENDLRIIKRFCWLPVNITDESKLQTETIWFEYIYVLQKYNRIYGTEKPAWKWQDQCLISFIPSEFNLKGLNDMFLSKDSKDKKLACGILKINYNGL